MAMETCALPTVLGRPGPVVTASVGDKILSSDRANFFKKLFRKGLWLAQLD